ncbi:MAG: hypothetical protein ACP5QG_02070 [candidate division WOR-3 bacterium]
MSWQGWAFVIIAWGVVGSLFFWCFWKVLAGKRNNDDSGGKTA